MYVTIGTEAAVVDKGGMPEVMRLEAHRRLTMSRTSDEEMGVTGVRQGEENRGGYDAEEEESEEEQWKMRKGKNWSFGCSFGSPMQFHSFRFTTSC
jgi:hypothetical protein